MDITTNLSLRFLQWFIRAIQLCCGIIVLAITSYFMANQDNRKLPIWTWERAVEGISGVFIIYTIACILTLFCFAGLKVVGLLYVILDIAFIGAHIYVAWSYRDGARSCTGNHVETLYATGPANASVGNYVHAQDGFSRFPTFEEACRMESACLAVAIVAIFFLIFSIIGEFALIKNHRRTAFKTGAGRGPFSFRRRNRTVRNPDTLPHHPTPADMERGKTSY